MALDKSRLDEIATVIALMYDPEVYSKLTYGRCSSRACFKY